MRRDFSVIVIICALQKWLTIIMCEINIGLEEGGIKEGAIRSSLHIALSMMGTYFPGAIVLAKNCRVLFFYGLLKMFLMLLNCNST